jgi:hypothetical protein
MHEKLIALYISKIGSTTDGILMRVLGLDATNQHHLNYMSVLMKDLEERKIVERFPKNLPYSCYFKSTSEGYAFVKNDLDATMRLIANDERLYDEFKRFLTKEERKKYARPKKLTRKLRIKSR